VHEAIEVLPRSVGKSGAGLYLLAARRTRDPNQPQVAVRSAVSDDELPDRGRTIKDRGEEVRP
jgi:hypothetical protein